MFTLANFHKQIDTAVLLRGKDYYNNGHVISVENTGDGKWTADVEGSEPYVVDVAFKADNEISDYSCDCPYEDDTCKHVVAVLFALRDEVKKMKVRPGKSLKKGVFDSLLQSLTSSEYREFIRSYTAGNKNFKTTFELFFSAKDSRINVEEKYVEVIQKIIRKYASHGFFRFGSNLQLSKEMGKILKTGVVYAGKNNFKDAFAVAKAFLKPAVEVLEENDDSNGNIGRQIDTVIELLETIAFSDTAAIDLKEQLFAFLQVQLKDDVYFDYGHFGFRLFDVLRGLAIQLNKSGTFLEFIDSEILRLSGKFDSYQEEYLQKMKIGFLQHIGKTEEAEKLIHQNLDIADVRAGVVNNAIGKKDFSMAKKIIAEGIKIAEGNDEPGTNTRWQKELLRIAILEKDTKTIRNYTKYFAFDRDFSAEYYRQWKATFTPAEWSIVIEEHIEDTKKIITKKWSIQNKFWRQRFPPRLLESLAPIYIEENFLDRLLALVQQENLLTSTLYYHPYLVKEYPNELMAIYVPALEEYGTESNSRSNYADLVKNMERIIEDIPEGKVKILNVAKRLKEKFSSKPRRPAMIEELDKILL